jgi:hypothetical protein
MSLFSPSVQSYIYHDEVDQISMFSPVNDTLRIKGKTDVISILEIYTL